MKGDSKYYVSVAHTGADIDHTIRAWEESLLEIRAAREQIAQDQAEGEIVLGPETVARDAAVAIDDPQSRACRGKPVGRHGLRDGAVGRGAVDRDRERDLVFVQERFERHRRHGRVVLEDGVDAQHDQPVDRAGDFVQPPRLRDRVRDAAGGTASGSACSTTMRPRRLASVIGRSVLNHRSTMSGGARGRARVGHSSQDPSLRQDDNGFAMARASTPEQVSS